MLTPQMISSLRSLSRPEKLRAMQLLVDELAHDEAPGLQAGASYEVWSPHEADGAVEILQGLLEQSKKAANG